MKKIFYILAAAIVALGTVACENEGLDNINPNINVDGDTVSFVAGINRTDLDGTATVWDADDTIVVTWNGNDYEFKNAETGDKNTFSCTAEGLSAIVDAENIKAVYSNNKDGNVDSAAGVAGALLEYEGAFGNIAFEVENAFLKFKANAGSEVKFTASAEIFSTGTELTLTATGEDQYVAVIPQTTTITYALDGVVCTTSEENTLRARKIYPLSTLDKVVVIKTKEDFLTFAEAVNNGTSYEGYTVKLNNDIDLEDAANTLSIVVKNNNITLDLNGKTLTANNTRTATHNFFFDVNAGGVLTVENGSIVYTHTGTNMGWNGAATAFDVTGGGVLNMNGVNVTVSGTDMNFCVHLNNWGEVTFNADGCKFNATYCGVRVFNSGYDMNNVTIKNSKMTGATRAFWVQMYIGDSLSKPETHPNDARKARLNFDIFGNNNTYELSGEATSPVRYGQTASIYFNPENGNQVLGNATDLSRFAKYVNEGIENYKGKTVELVKDIDLGGAEWTPVGQTGATQFHGTFDGQGHTIKGLTINAPESYSTNYATGMFGWVETGAVIKNIVLDEAKINGYHYVGAIAGYMSGSAKIEGCKVINSKIVADPTKKDTAGEFNGDKVGGIVGYTNGSNVISGNEVSKTTIKGYRHMGGIVGYLLGTAENNTVGDNVVITVNNDNNYKNYAIQSNYGVNNIAGVVTGSATNNNGEVTIVWGDIPASSAVQVGSTKYGTIKAAIAAAESGATITLLEDIALEGLTEGALMKVDKKLTLDVGEHTLTATLPTATKNASIFTVTKGAEFTLVGAGNIVIENGGGSNIGNHFISNEGGIVNLEMDGGIELNVVDTPFINCIVDNNSTLGAATLNVKKGTYKQNSGNIFRNFVNHKTELATINISGGSIIGTGEKAIYIWNQKMGKTTGILNITAGTFVNVQIDNDDKTLNQVTFTAEGYKLQQNANGYYDVVEKTPVAKVGEQGYETIKDAIAAANAASASEIVIIDNVDLAEDSLSGFAGTIKGGEDVVLDFSNFPAASNYAFPISGTTTFKNITFKFPASPSSYLSAGLVGEGEFTFENCAFEGCFTINGNAEWAFNKCEFTNNDYYASFVYAAKEVVFTECSFSGKDRAAKIYGDGGDLYVEYHNCEFTSTTTNKAAIAIDATNANTIVIVDGCSQTNMNGLYSLDGTKGVVNPVAKDNNGKFYGSFEAALAAAEAGSTIELLADIESGDIITINKNITINGNNKTINSTAARAINIATEGEVTIKNLIVVATGERAVNVITYPATVKLEGVNLTSSNYTVNVATSAGAAKVDIQKSTLRGLNTVNINGAGAEVTIDDCEIYCDDNNTTEGEDYAALCLGRDAVGGSIAATNSNIYITEGSDSTKGCNNASDGTITIDGSTDGVVVKYAAIIVGDYYYAFNTVDEAIEFDETATITLLRDATIGTEGTYTIDVNGHELSAAEGLVITTTEDGNGNVTYTVAKAFVAEKSEYGVVGSFQGWDVAAGKPVAMYTTPEEGWFVAKGVELYKTDEFKIVKGNSWNTSYGLASPGVLATDKEVTIQTSNSQNMKAAKNGKFDIYLNPTANKIKYTCVEEYTGTVNITINNEAKWSPVYITLKSGSTTIVNKATVSNNVYAISMDYIGESLSYTLTTSDTSKELKGNATITKEGVTINLVEEVIKLTFILDTDNTKQWWGTEAYIYIWNTDSSVNNSWPGTKMVYDGNYTFHFDLPASLAGKKLTYIINRQTNGNWQSDTAYINKLSKDGHTINGSSIGIN